MIKPGVNGADAEMVLYNADGGVAEMSGNGMRSLAWVAAREGLGRDGTPRRRHRRRAAAHVDARRATRDGDGRRGHRRHGAGHLRPRADPARTRRRRSTSAPTYHGTHYEGDAAGMGNPHLVLFVDDPATARVTQHGPHLEHDDRFPRRTNVEFVRVTPGADRRARHAGLGAWGGRDAELRHRRVRGRRGRAPARAGGRAASSCTSPAATSSVELGDTIRLGGPVVHVFDVEVELPEVPRTEIVA